MKKRKKESCDDALEGGKEGRKDGRMEGWKDGRKDGRMEGGDGQTLTDASEQTERKGWGWGWGR